MPTMAGVTNHEVTACKECTQMCLLIHQNHDPSSIVSSFFKIMYGDRYSEAMFLPPIFARKLASFVDKEIRLEDSCGKSWKVTLSKFDGSLAFWQGWNDFASDHGIELGDLLMFYYVKGSHFVVHIYGRSACQKPNLSNENRKNQVKRAKLSRDSTSGDDPSNTFEKESGKEYPNSPVVSEPEINIISPDHNVTDVHKSPRFAENVSNSGNNCRTAQIVCYEEEQDIMMVDRDTGFAGNDNRNGLLDLSCFEMVDMESHPRETNHALSNGVYVNSQHSASSVDKYPMAEPGGEDISEGAFDIDIVDLDDTVKDNLVTPERKCNEAFGTKTVPIANSEIHNGNNQSREKDEIHHGTGKAPCRGSRLSAGAIRPSIITLDYPDSSAVSTCKGIEGKSAARSGEEGFSKVKKEHDPTTIWSQNFHQKLSGISLELNKVFLSAGKEGPSKLKSEHDPTTICSQNAHQKVSRDTSDINKFFLSAGKGVSNVKNEYDPTTGSQNVHRKLSGTSDSSKFIVPSGTGEKLKSVKKEIIEMRQEQKQVDKLVKPEPLDEPDSVPPLAAHITCQVSTESENFLELPARLPPFGQRKLLSTEQKIIYLRDSDSRLWPVLYHEKYGFKMLTEGWPEFRKANRIIPGDECIFMMENNADSIFGVQIIRRS